jgi:hypothetical protein
MSIRTLIAAVGLATCAAVAAAQNGPSVHIPTTSACIPHHQQREILSRIAANRRRFNIPILPSDGPLLYPLVPLGGTVYRDITTGNFVDLNAGGGVTNYLCEHYGNESHAGCDYGSPTWEEMAIGIPIFAALDGVVVDVHDGDPDTNTSCQPGGNYVILDHGGGRTAWYFHMKKDSVAVSLSQVVKAGQQLGLVGSSGCSFGPHLHFQSMNAATVFEPYAGTCRPGISGWLNQIDPPATAWLRDFGVTAIDPQTVPGLPSRLPTQPQMLFSDGNIYYWMHLCDIPPNSNWTEHYIRPDGSLEFSLGPFAFGNADIIKFHPIYIPRFIGGMHSIPGTWRIRFDVNGVQVFDAPVEVAAIATPGFNRPPLPISAAFDPPIPGAGDVIFARITSPGGIRDLDWNLVRYRYQWKLNGATIRDVTHRGMADCIPRDTAAGGDILQCTITPNDGQVDGTGTTLTLAFGCYANCDGSSASPRLTANDFACFLNAYASGSPSANCDQSSATPQLTANDFACFLNAFASGCS